MALNLTTAIPISLLLLFLFVQSPLAVTGDSPSAYDVLQGYNFPVGLLPKGVIKYDLDESTGRFHAYLNDTCSFSLEGSYQLKYKSTISGIISNNRLKDLSGISVKVFFVWLNIVEVIRDDEELEFSVGIASASFPIDNFYECPQCGCGLDCGNGRTVRILSPGLGLGTCFHPVISSLRTMNVSQGVNRRLCFARLSHVYDCELQIYVAIKQLLSE
ncbi:hypothetical protein Goari_006690 [Gossypium aridum]|uniref:Uncharacterized protein n=1 Tax=Gossypium aridum TaxID=34290 RepID=A0A7J8XPZ8_GOSAI|nr:hypothetical protein [Gossypium aridum]